MSTPTRAATLRLRAFGVWQLPTVLLASAAWVALALSPAVEVGLTGPTAGLLLVLLASVGALAVYRAGVGPGWRILVPAVDLAGLAVINAAAAQVLPSTMLIGAIPVVWLGYEFGRRGMVVAWVGVVAVALLPHLSDPPGTRGTLAMVDVALTTCIGGGVAIVASVVGRILSRSRKRLVQDAHRLNTELDTLNGIMLAVDAAIVVAIHGEPPRLNDEARRVSAHARAPDDAPGEATHIYERDGHTPVPAQRQPFVRALAGETYRDLMCCVGRPGEQVVMVSSCHQITAADGSTIGSVVVGFDATTLVDAVRVREEFLTTVSHELRTPLTSITASLEMLHGEIDDVRRGDTGPEVAERLLSIASRNAGTLLNRINQLLSAAPGAVEEIAPRPTDVGRLVRDSVVKHREHAADRGVVLEVHACTDVIVDVDPVAFERIVDNLVSNAIKYTQASGLVTVEVEVGEGRLHLQVADTGIGMSPDEQRQVFDRFYRSTSVISAAVPGIGIGLTVTKRLVNLLGGQITVASQRGRGTTMTVVLPAAPRELAAQGHSSVRRHPPAPTRS